MTFLVASLTTVTEDKFSGSSVSVVSSMKQVLSEIQ
jgi:hypothetical protein